MQHIARALPCLALIAVACDAGSSSGDGGGSGGTGGQATTTQGTLSIAAGTRSPKNPGVLGVNYWLWSPTWDDNVAGTEPSIGRLKPGLLRVGGHNNDNNTPDPFDDAELDDAVAYARAVGAEPLLQVPLLSDAEGNPPSAETAAAMVRYANVTREYGVKYFSIGNEPDLYPDQEAGMASYSAADYCESVEAFVPAMLAVDPSIQIVGPDLSWKYQSGPLDWLTPILASCGERFDVIAVHRYALAPEQTTIAEAASDAARFRSTIQSLRSKVAASPRGERPLAISEANITYNGDPTLPQFEASPGTLPAGLWAADTLGVALEENLWGLDFWSISEGWTLGLIDLNEQPRPAYFALTLFSEHFGDTLLKVASAPNGVRAYASRTASDDTTQAIVINWTQSNVELTVEVSGLTASESLTAKFQLPPLSVSALEMPDAGDPSGLVYSEAERSAGKEPSPLPTLSSALERE